jgi:hypothetical protein
MEVLCQAMASRLTRYPGPHMHSLTSELNMPNREANCVGFGFCSRATLECPNGKTCRPQNIDLGVVGIILTEGNKRILLGLIEI